MYGVYVINFEIIYKSHKLLTKIDYTAAAAVVVVIITFFNKNVDDHKATLAPKHLKHKTQYRPVGYAQTRSST